MRLGANADHGADGPLTVGDLSSPAPVSEAVVDSGKAFGLLPNEDFNGADAQGLGLFQVTQRSGKRCSAARAYPGPALERRRLEVCTIAHVTGVAFSERTATGIRLRDKDGERVLALRPDGEMLPCAGAVHTPQMQMLSEIGPGTELQLNGMEVLHDLPEPGRNLQDHLDVALMHSANSRASIGLAASLLPRGFTVGWSYVRRRTKMLTSNAAEIGGIARSRPEWTRPNLQFHFLPAYLVDHGRKLKLGHGDTLLVCDPLPESRGRIGLNDPSPMAPPKIDPAYLSHPQHGNDDRRLGHAAHSGGITNAPTMMIAANAADILLGKTTS